MKEKLNVAYLNGAEGGKPTKGGDGGSSGDSGSLPFKLAYYKIDKDALTTNNLPLENVINSLAEMSASINMILSVKGYWDNGDSRAVPMNYLFFFNQGNITDFCFCVTEYCKYPYKKIGNTEKTLDTNTDFFGMLRIFGVTEEVIGISKQVFIPITEEEYYTLE